MEAPIIKLAMITMIIIPLPLMASGPKYQYPSPRGMNDEMSNIYNDIKNPAINVGTASTMTITNATVTTLTASTATIANLHGTTTANNACPGCVGEYVESIVSSVNFPASGTFGDLTSISLTSGDWEVSFNYEYKANGSTHSGDTVLGISTTSGNSSTGLVPGSNRLDFTVGGGSLDYTGSLAAYRVSLAATTTVYMKYSDNFATATPFIYARLSARRMR